MINGSPKSSDWEKIAAGYADSADSATKLQTSRLLWGQSFNGTADVNGDIHSSGTINCNALNVGRFFINDSAINNTLSSGET